METKEHQEHEPKITIVDGKDVAQYLTPELKDKFIRYLSTVNSGGELDEEYFQGYLKRFEKRIREGRITLLLADNEPASVGALYIAGRMSDRRNLYEMGNLVTLPEFQGRGFASKLMDYRFQKVRADHPECPVIATTKDPLVIKKCLKLGMKEYPMEDVMRIRVPKDTYMVSRKPSRAARQSMAKLFGGEVIEESDSPKDLEEQYENEIRTMSREMTEKGYKVYLFDPSENPEPS